MMSRARIAERVVKSLFGMLTCSRLIVVRGVTRGAATPDWATSSPPPSSGRRRSGSRPAERTSSSARTACRRTGTGRAFHTDRGVVGLGQLGIPPAARAWAGRRPRPAPAPGPPTTPSRPASRGSASVPGAGLAHGQARPATQGRAPRPSRTAGSLVAQELDEVGSGHEAQQPPRSTTVSISSAR